MSENFANKLLSDGDNPLAKNEVDRLLSDHMNSMLVLRKKQELEKIKVQAKNQEMVKARPGLVAAVAHNVPTPPPPIGRESKANNELPQTSTVPKQVQPEKDLEGVGKIFWTMKEEDVRETTPVAARKTSRQESDNEFDDEEEVWRQYQDNLARKDDSDTEVCKPICTLYLVQVPMLWPGAATIVKCTDHILSSPPLPQLRASEKLPVTCG